MQGPKRLVKYFAENGTFRIAPHEFNLPSGAAVRSRCRCAFRCRYTVYRREAAYCVYLPAARAFARRCAHATRSKEFALSGCRRLTGLTPVDFPCPGSWLFTKVYRGLYILF
jgi:hypothetical protein